jgi:hypothetical protein
MIKQGYDSPSGNLAKEARNSLHLGLCFAKQTVISGPLHAVVVMPTFQAPQQLGCVKRGNSACS